MLPRRLLRGHRVVGRRRHLQVGVIGHGNMGRGVAASLARAGHDVVVYDADGAQTLRRPSTITAVDSVAAACRRADAVLLSLPHEAAERAVVADLLEARPPLVLNCAEIKILWRVRAESSRRPPRHRRDALSAEYVKRLTPAASTGRPPPLYNQPCCSRNLSPWVRAACASFRPHRHRSQLLRSTSPPRSSSLASPVRGCARCPPC